MDLALNNLQRLICHKSHQPTKQHMKDFHILLSRVQQRDNQFQMLSQSYFVLLSFRFLKFCLVLRKTLQKINKDR